jgi:hypothetical protein
MMKLVSQEQKPVPDPNNAPPGRDGEAVPPGGSDPFAQDIEDLLREAPDVPPAPAVWRRIEARLRDKAAPKPDRPGGAKR